MIPIFDQSTLRSLPLYDVVIPSYRRAHVVEDAVLSAIKQDHPPSRVVVVDDGSDDGSASIILDLADRYPTVLACILPRNSGASNARNVGISMSAAPWIAFLDSDDMWVDGAARALLSTSASPSSDVIVGRFSRVESNDDVGEPECGWGGGDIREALAGGGVIGPSWSLIRRDVVLAIEGFDPSFRNCNDWDFYTRAAAHGARFARIEDTIALYRTVKGGRLGNDHVAGEINASRVRAHPYLSSVLR